MRLAYLGIKESLHIKGNLISFNYKSRNIEFMQTRSLETLVRISKVQSFSVAAELQGMTLSALSMQMKALEVEFGLELFDRSCRPPRLTPVGRQIAEQAENVIAQAQLLQNLTIPNDSLVGHFRVGFIQSASVRILPKFIQRARVETPQGSFQYLTGLSEHLADLVLNNQIDAAVVTQVEGLSDDLRYDVIARENLALVVPTTRAKTPIAELPDTLPFIHFMPSTGIGRLIAKHQETLTRKPANILVLDSIEAAMECVKFGLGYTILPLPDIKRYRDEHVFIHPPGSSRIDRSLSFVTRRDAQTARWRSQILALCLGN